MLKESCILNALFMYDGSGTLYNTKQLLFRKFDCEIRCIKSGSLKKITYFSFCVVKHGTLLNECSALQILY